MGLPPAPGLRPPAVPPLALDPALTVPNGNAILDDETIMDDQKCRDYANALRGLDEDHEQLNQRLRDIETLRTSLENQLRNRRESLWNAFSHTVENINLDELAWQ